MKDYITLILFVLGIFVEIAPIKINPISALGKLFTKDLNNKLSDIEKNVDYNDIDAVRSRILANDTLLAKGEVFTQDQWNCLYKDIEKWKRYHQKYEDLNGIIKLTIEHIEECYKQQHYGEK